MSFIALRPRSNLLALTRVAGGFGALSRAKVGAGCGCVDDQEVADVMKAIGMPHAAKMHELGAGGAGVLWSPNDWYLHAKEEDDPDPRKGRLFRLLRQIARELPGQSRVSLEAEVDALQADHDRYVYPYVARGELPPAAEMAVHGAREDALIKRYGRRMLDIVGAGRGHDAESTTKTGANTRVGDVFGLAKTLPPETNKFIAPYFACWNGISADARGPEGTGGRYTNPALNADFKNLYDMPGHGVIGLEYLADVPNTADARIAAIRAHVIAGDSPAIQRRYMKYADASQDGLAALTRTVIEATKDPSKLPAVAKSLGLPIEKAEIARQDLLKWLDTPGGSILKALWSAVGPQVMTLIRQTVAEVSGEVTSTLNSIGAMSSAVPILGFIVQSFTLVYGSIVERAAEAKRSTCQSYLQDISEHITRLANAGMPTPWHLVDLGLDCDAVVKKTLAAEKSEPGTPLSVALVTAQNTDWYTMGTPASVKGIERWDGESYVGWGPGLSPLDLIALKKWWGLATLLWSTEQVGPVMRSLGGDRWGGWLASDEQVMLVAAPIAVSYGLDVDTFARKLWDRSLGWRSRPELFVSRAGGGCGKVVDNARVIQFAVLARDAFDLAEEEKNKHPFFFPLRIDPTVDPALAASSGASGTGSTALPLAIGAAAGGAVRWMGGSWPMAAVPLGIAALVTFLHRPSPPAPILRNKYINYTKVSPGLATVVERSGGVLDRMGG